MQILLSLHNAPNFIKYVWGDLNACTFLEDSSKFKQAFACQDALCKKIFIGNMEKGYFEIEMKFVFILSCKMCGLPGNIGGGRLSSCHGWQAPARGEPRPKRFRHVTSRQETLHCPRDKVGSRKPPGGNLILALGRVLPPSNFQNWSIFQLLTEFVMMVVAGRGRRQDTAPPN